MEYRTLGRTGLRVSAVALGCEGFMNRPEEEVRADFDFAIENGINFLDLYASNPELRSSIGAALAGRRSSYRGTSARYGKRGSISARAIRRRRRPHSTTCSRGWGRITSI